MSENILQINFSPEKDLKTGTIHYFQTQLGFNFDNLKTSDLPISLQIKNQNYDLQIVFQLTDEEINNSPLEGWRAKPDGVDPQTDLKYSKYLVCSYDFGDLEKIPNKSFLANFNRQLSAKFDSISGMPNLIIFRYIVNQKTYITFSVAELREDSNKRTGKYVTNKVILLKDIEIEDTHKGHLKILNDLKNQTKTVRNFDELHEKWLKVLAIETLSESFYAEVESIFKNSLKLVDIPSSDEIKQDFLLKFFGRLMFCWFLKAKGWVSAEVLNCQLLEKDFIQKGQKNGLNYYHQVLEVLFFGLLNCDGEIKINPNSQLKPEIWQKLSQTPYLNGGLFQNTPNDFFGKNDIEKIPNEIIFQLFTLFEKYYFTIDENTPDNQEIGVDPEMMGSIFEGLVATRSGTGSFYTRKSVVDYMVEMSLLESLKNKCQLNFDQNTEKQKLLGWLNLEVLDLENRIRIFQREKAVFLSQVIDTELSISSYLIAKLKGRRFNFQTKDFEDCNPHPESNLDIFEKILNDEFEIKSQFIPLPNVINVKQENGQHKELVIPKIGLVLRISGQDFISIWTIGLNENLILDTIFRIYQPKKIHKFQQKNTQNFLELVRYFESINKTHLTKRLLKLYFDQQKIPQMESLLQTNKFSEVSWEDTAFLPSDKPPGPRISGVHEIYTEIIEKNNSFVKQTYKNNKIEGYIYRYIGSFPTNYEARKITEINQILKSLKILDPACGSGAFPVGILQRITELRQFLGEKDLYKIKNETLQNCIYGVDLMPIAVEITKLRCWLYLVVDQPNLGLNKNGRFVAEPLPNIDLHFCQGDSLVAQIPFANLPNNDTIQKLTQLKNTYYNEHSDKKLTVKKDIQNLISAEYHKSLDSKINNLNIQIQSLKSQLQGDEIFLTEKQNTKQNELKKVQMGSQIQLWQNQINELEKQKELKGFHYQLNLCELFENKNNQITSKIDIIIGNPPYVSTKETGDQYKHFLQSTFGFSDDLYSHFFFKSLQSHQDFGMPAPALLKTGGILCFITSKTYWTIQTKNNLRKLLLSKKIIEINDVGNPFYKSAMVDTAICLLENTDIIKQNNDISFGESQNMEYQEYNLNYKNSQSKDQKHILDFENTEQTYTISNQIYTKAVNQVIFEPNQVNLNIYNKYNQKVSELMEKWWDKIKTAGNITKNQTELEKYRNELKAGDITLLGLVTDGGVGLQTGENGKYVGILDGTKEADRVRETRPEKLFKFLQSTENATKEIASKYPQSSTNFDPLKGVSKMTITTFLNSLTEYQIRELFDSLKIKHGRDIFGQGYLYRIVQAEEVANLDTLTDEEKQNGIKTLPLFKGSNSQGLGVSFVPYDKGDKDGNRWYLKTPYYIEWSWENVQWMKKDPKARFQGYNFFFREGFCWSFALLPTQEESKYIKCRLKDRSVNDVMSMALYNFCEKTTDKYIVSLLNSKFMYDYLKTFINSTAGQQINDFRQLPIIIPTASQLTDFENLFDRAYQIKLQQFEGTLTETVAKSKLDQIQKELDEMVEGLYGLTEEEISVIIG
jgi:hypothetical protein